MFDPAKSGLISEKIFHYGTNLKKSVPNHTPEPLFYRYPDCAQKSEMVAFYGGLNRSVNPPEIKPPFFELGNM